MKDKVKLFFLMIAMAAFIPAFVSAATISFNSETDCAALKKLKAVLLVYSSSCPYCQEFVPTYTDIANNSQYANWSFYILELKDKDSVWINGKRFRGLVCKHIIEFVPTVLINNKELPDANDTNEKNISVLQAYLNAHA